MVFPICFNAITNPGFSFFFLYSVGLVLYTSYLASLSALAGNRPHASYTITDTFRAGFMAGAMQSLAAAPIDAIVTRFSVSEILHHQEHQQRSMWSYSLEKLREVGPRGVFAGYPISFVKESLGFAFFFSTFEAIKGPWYRSYMWLRGHAEGEGSRAVYPSFILAAGALAAVSVQVVHYPVGKIQKLFLMRLESLNAIAKSTRAAAAPSMLREGTGLLTRRGIYKRTFKQADKIVRKHQKELGLPLPTKPSGVALMWTRWLYSGFVRATLSTLPSTSLGLVVFEIMRIKYAADLQDLDDVFQA